MDEVKHGKVMKEVNFTRTVQFVKFAQWTLDPKKQTITDGDESRELEPLLYKILCYLLLNIDQIITRQDLIDDVWCQHYVDDNAINRAISELRKLLKSEKFKGVIIKTHYRKGYSLAVDREIVLFEDGGQSSNPEVTPPPTKKSKKNYSTILIGLMLLVVAITLSMLYFLPAKKNENQGLSAFKEHSFDSFEERAITWQEAYYSYLILHPDSNYYAYLSESDTSKSIVVRSMKHDDAKKFTFPDSSVEPLGFSTSLSHLFYREKTADGACAIWRIDYLKETDAQKVMGCDKQIRNLLEVDNRYLLYDKLGFREKSHTAALYIFDRKRELEFRISSPNASSFGDQLLHYDSSNGRVYFKRMQSEFTEVFYTDVEGSNLVQVATITGVVNNFTIVDNQLYWFDLLSQSVKAFDIDQGVEVENIKNNSSVEYRNIWRVAKDKYLAQQKDFEVVTTLYSKDLVKQLDITGARDAAALENMDQFVVISNVDHINEHLLSFLDKQGRVIRQVQLDEFAYRVKVNKSNSLIYIRLDKDIKVFDLTGKLVNEFSFDEKVVEIEASNDSQIAVVVQKGKINRALLIDSMTGKQRLLPIRDVLWFTCFTESKCITQNFFREVRLYDLEEGAFTGQSTYVEPFFPNFTLFGAELIYFDGKKLMEFDPEALSQNELKSYDPSEQGNLLNMRLIDNDGSYLTFAITRKQNAITVFETK
ncbi:hypothetical protein DS891_14550 [Pseudoalteromonas sp. JC28]|nr:hypothetical protein [Pseudoalteromonas sp. JC28]